VAIQEPSWLKAPDAAGEYTKGLAIGAQVSEAKARLQAQAEETSARLRQQSDQMEQQHAVEQQKIQVAQSYHQQQSELRKQRLGQIEAVNAEKTKAAARAFEAKQAWQTGLDHIDNDTSLTPEQKDAQKTRLIMRLAPVMGIAGTEAATMLRETRPPKPTVPASVTDNGDFVKVTQPNGTVSLHAKPKSGASTVKVKVSDAPGGILTVPQERARALIAGLPQDMADDPVNKAALSITPVGPYNRVPRGEKPSQPPSNQDVPVTKLDTQADVVAAYKAGKLTREQAAKMLKDEFGVKE
jgi:hypothetical protein